MDTVRLTKRQSDPPTVTVTWYRTSEDLPMTIAAVIDNYGHKIYHRDNKWMALGADGGYFECREPEFWAYIPKLPR